MTRDSLNGSFFVIVLTCCLVVVPGGWWWYAKQYRPVQIAKQAVLEKLVDPSSAQFKDVQLVDGSLVCGEVNAKNRMGGYVGYASFAVIDGRDAAIDKDDDPVKVAKNLCDKIAATAK